MASANGTFDASGSSAITANVFAVPRISQRAIEYGTEHFAGS